MVVVFREIAAAMRYTEGAKLSKFGDLMLNGIDKGAVKFKPSLR